MISRPSRAAATLLALALAACGQKGPLYLPDTTHGEIVTRPSPATTGVENSPASPDSPQQTAPPAPAPADKDKKNGAAPPPK